MFEGLDTHDTKSRRGDMGTIRDEGRLGTFENTRSFNAQTVMLGKRGVAWEFRGDVSFVTPPIWGSIVGLTQSKRGKKMSVRSAALAHELSMAWLRNAFAGFLAASVLVLLLILVP